MQIVFDKLSVDIKKTWLGQLELSINQIMWCQRFIDFQSAFAYLQFAASELGACKIKNKTSQPWPLAVPATYPVHSGIFVFPPTLGGPFNGHSNLLHLSVVRLFLQFYAWKRLGLIFKRVAAKSQRFAAGCGENCEPDWKIMRLLR